MKDRKGSIRMENCNPASAFCHMAAKHPDRLAISVGKSQISYGDLAAQARAIAAHVGSAAKSVRVGILASRSIEAYAGILGAAWAGGTYIPLNLKWPAERLIALLEMLELDALVVDAVGLQLLSPDVLAHAPAKIILPGHAALPTPAGVIATGVAALPESAIAPVPVGPDHLAYVIFTSGTTGMPKGVMISAGSLSSYLGSTRGWTGFTPEDRIAETCDVTFDLSVHNMYLCFEAGASLHLMSQLEMLGPQHFIRNRAITAWMSVPTVLSLMTKTGALKPGIFPSLRLSIFCGEPLPLAGVQAWQAAAPNSVVENIYGPTEVTVICLRQRVTDVPAVTPGRGIIAIGKPYDTMDVAIFDDSQRRVPDGTPGEIAMRGPQVGVGYFGAPEQTADRFRVIDGERWYLTGDLGSRDPDGTFHHLGRVDNQVKVKGNRIELEEVEAHLRRAGGTDLVAAVAWPVTFGSAEGLVGFLAGTALGPTEIINTMLKSLPRYMVPTEIRVVDELPRNINGKIDRRALFDDLEAARQDPSATAKERSIA